MATKGTNRTVYKNRPLTVPEQIAECITQAILNGDYRPGDRILELDLAEQFHTSRGPIREALRILEKSGVVTLLPHRGAHVTTMTTDEVDNLFQIRRDLMRLLIRSVAPASAEVLAQLEHHVAKLEALDLHHSTPAAYTSGTRRASDLLFSTCRNGQLTEILHTLSLQTARYTQLAFNDLQRRRDSVAGWRQLVEALKTNEVERAGSVLENLIEQSRLAARKALTGQNPPAKALASTSGIKASS
jgi:DNA-binding GntR family transcriptional regulator